MQEAFEILQRRRDGRASAAHLAAAVLQLPDLDQLTAAMLISELISNDCRLRLTDTHEVEIVCEDVEVRALAESDFVVVDVETTGAKSPPGRITEIGAYRVSGGRVVDEFQTLLNPEVPIPPFIVGLTGITDQMVKGAPLFAEIAADWLDFAGRSVLVAHNAQFDVRFINHEVARVFPGQRMLNSQLCTVGLSRRIIPDLLNHRLHTVAEHFSVKIYNRHRAAGDALATAEIFIRLLEILDRHGVRDLASARRFRPETRGQWSAVSSQRSANSF
ncbi:MAG: exonuclease domain-containing protein [Acidobacteriota bacterium]|nr:exonuclease domain-containing protein [Acidobacteriota bacterium]